MHEVALLNAGKIARMILTTYSCFLGEEVSRAHKSTTDDMNCEEIDDVQKVL